MKNQKYFMLSTMISEKKILELWKIKLIVYALRDASWIKKMAFAPILVLIVDAGLSEFKRNAVLFIFLVSLIYILMSIGIYRKIRLVQSKKKKIDNAYPLIAILHSAFDLTSLLIVIVAFLLMTALMIQNMSAVKLISDLMLALLLLVIIISILFSPKILTSKSLSQMNNGKSANRLLFFLSLATIMPGFFIFVTALVIQTGQVDLLKAIFGFFSYLGSMILVPYIVSGFVELLVLIKSRWPDVKRSGSEFLF